MTLVERKGVNRREFLTFAAAGAALTVIGPLEIMSLAQDANMAGAQAGQAASGPFNGIAPEHFENARRRAAALVAKLELNEKFPQFGTQAPAVDRIGLAAFNYYGSEGLHGLHHGGPITSFPMPLAMGCSWNRSLILQVFTIVSDEIWAWHKKNGQSLAVFSPPTVNMGTRDPRWGRIGENYSEDPYLVAQMAINTIHGMQGNDPRYLKTIACAKHFIANDTDSDRETTSATVDPRSFWEYYSRGFEACVKEGHVFTVMSSYNEMNGIPTTASPFLLTYLLRERWGFQGYVVSDCDAVGDISNTHHFVPTLAEAAALAVNAGCDINCGDTLKDNLGKAVEEMLISESTLDASLTRSFTGRVLLGEYDPPEQNPYHTIPVSCLEDPAHRELACEAARQSIILFKNDNETLPLNKKKLKKIAVIGPMADWCQLGGYSGTPQILISPLKGIREYLGIPSVPSYRKRASDYVELDTHAELEPCSEGGDNLTHINDGSWFRYNDVLFTGATEFQARVASNEKQGMHGGTLEVRLDSLNGPLLCTLHVSETGDGQKWIDVQAPIQATRPIVGERTVYLRFSGVTGDLFNFQSFSLTPEKPVKAPRHGPVEVLHARGCTAIGSKDPALFAEAVQAARQADVVLVFAGSDEQVGSEGQDRDFLHLPGAQHELIQAVHAANPRTILVISSNAPVAVNWEQENLPAILGGLPLGGEQGQAMAEVIFGDSNPGGKTSTTWYRKTEDLPDFHDYDIRHGRTYMYYQGDPLYPFGYGLSYSKFKYGNLRVDGPVLQRGGKITLQADVTNTSSRDGDEIVQLYVHFVKSAVKRPIRQLVNFDRVRIKAGETKAVSLELSYEDRALRYWDEDKYDFVVEPGTLELQIGASSADIKLKGQVQLAD